MKRVFAFLLCAAVLATGQLAPRRAPGFCLADTSGQWRDLADYRGKVVLLEFMQTTCAHCANFAPKLTSAAKKYGDKLQIISIALAPDTPQGMVQFSKSHGLTWPLVLDQGQVAASYVRKGEINFPNLYLVDANGFIVNSWEYGGLTRDVFEGDRLTRELDKLIGSASSSPVQKK